MVKRHPAVQASMVSGSEALLHGAVFAVMFPPLFVATLAAEIGRRDAAGASVMSLIHQAAADARSAISIALDG